MPEGLFSRRERGATVLCAATVVVLLAAHLTPVASWLQIGGSVAAIVMLLVAIVMWVGPLSAIPDLPGRRGWCFLWSYQFGMIIVAGLVLGPPLAWAAGSQHRSVDPNAGGRIRPLSAVRPADREVSRPVHLPRLLSAQHGQRQRLRCLGPISDAARFAALPKGSQPRRHAPTRRSRETERRAPRQPLTGQRRPHPGPLRRRPAQRRRLQTERCHGSQAVATRRRRRRPKRPLTG